MPQGESPVQGAPPRDRPAERVHRLCPVPTRHRRLALPKRVRHDEPTSARSAIGAAQTQTHVIVQACRAPPTAQPRVDVRPNPAGPRSGRQPQRRHRVPPAVQRAPSGKHPSHSTRSA